MTLRKADQARRPPRFGADVMRLRSLLMTGHIAEAVEVDPESGSVVIRVSQSRLLLFSRICQHGVDRLYAAEAREGNVEPI